MRTVSLLANRYKVDFVKCKTNADLQGQSEPSLSPKGQPAEWLGLAELRSRTV